ncbi:MAG: PspC domain-containing protein [bacterium]
MHKRLYLSKKDKVIAGVAGGLGEYLDVDPVFIRIIFVVALFAGGFGLLAYIVAWIILPERPNGVNAASAPQSEPQPGQSIPASPPPPPPQPAQQGRGGLIFGSILVVLGLLFLAENFIENFHFGDWWPLILVAMGAGLLYKAFRPSQS